MTFRVAIDFGTSSTCVVAAIGERQPQVVVIDGQPLLPSAVYAASDGTLFVGQEAERQAAVDPARFEPTPKRRIDEGELLLGDTVLQVVDVMRAVLARAVGEARRLAANAEVDLLVLTHPADWGAVRTRLLRQAASGLGREVALVPEPVAAAVFHAATYAPAEDNPEKTVAFTGNPGDTLAVLDFGGGTIDASVVRRTESQRRRTAFDVLATRGDPGFGGADIDQALLEHVGSLVSSADQSAWDELVRGRELADRRRRRVLRQDVRGAKETLSRHAYTDVPMPPPFADAHVTREQLEKLIVSPLERAVELTLATVEDAGLRPERLTAIFLVGGSSRIPMISRLIHERTGVVPTTLDQPETVVARGALRAVQVIPDRGGALPGAPSDRGNAASAASAAAGAAGAAFAPQGAPVSPPQGQPQGPHPSTPQHPSTPHGPPPHPRTPPRQPQQAHPSPQQSPPAQPPQNPGGPPPQGHGTAPPGPAPRTAPGPQAPGPQAPHYGAPGFPQEQAASPSGSAVPAGGVRRGRKRVLVWSSVGLVALLLAGAAGWFFFLRDDSPSGKQVSRFSYTFVAPEGWRQAEENVQRASITYGPPNAQRDLVIVQQIQQDFDASEQRRRLFDKIRAEAAGHPGRYESFREHKEFGGRDTIYYEENASNGNGVIEWYVLANGSVQVSVGCQAGQQERELESGCEQIVRTLEFTN